MGLFSRRSKPTPPTAVNTGGGLAGGPSEELVAQHGLRILEASQRHRGGCCPAVCGKTNSCSGR